MKMISNTNSTSTKGVTLMSLTGSFSCHDELFIQNPLDTVGEFSAEIPEVITQTAGLIAEEGVGDQGGDGREQPGGGGDRSG